ncbi:MAG: glutamate-1-semialdehyde-2,1-aminomutase [Candidatus Omnitrophica bacterium]|nr:glutamate-1-semialdehyde-2,1-aminomutase [Candidatus Omnitrophota bacterium]
MQSRSLYKRAQKSIPSGVNSPVRAFKSVGGTPVFVKKASGAFLWDEDGRRYLDFCASWGPMIFGHAPRGLLSALAYGASSGTSFGAATRAEVMMAEAVRSFFPSMEKIRMTSSGTEAVMSALRLARGFTGRDKIVKIDGGYHGHVDSMLVKAGSGGATFGLPDSAGIPKALARLTLTVPFNDSRALKALFQKEGRSIAALILEPVPANMGVVPPDPDYLQTARQVTRRTGSLLIFDEVISGFRVSPGGAQKKYGVTPDLTCLGKILGGGLPAAAFGGRRDIMDQLAPAGPVYQAGTLSGNPLAMTAGLWVMCELKDRKKRKLLDRLAEHFLSDFRAMLAREKFPVTLNSEDSMFTLFFTPRPVRDYADAKSSDTRAYARYFHACLKRGVYLAPSQFEANFVSTAHSAPQLKTAVRIFRDALRETFSEGSAHGA